MDLRYPIGKYKQEEPVSKEQLAAWLAEIEGAPPQYRAAVAGFSEAQLSTPYRPEGWTVKQLIHHVGDSHLNSYVRFKWALTEEEPLIKAYHQDGWASHPSPDTLDTAADLDFLDLVHKRWVTLLRSIDPEGWKRGLLHPETGNRMQLDWMAGMYAWHEPAPSGPHHGPSRTRRVVEGGSYETPLPTHLSPLNRFIESGGPGGQNVVHRFGER